MDRRGARRRGDAEVAHALRRAMEAGVRDTMTSPMGEQPIFLWMDTFWASTTRPTSFEAGQPVTILHAGSRVFPDGYGGLQVGTPASCITAR